MYKLNCIFLHRLQEHTGKGLRTGLIKIITKNKELRIKQTKWKCKDQSPCKNESTYSVKTNILPHVKMIYNDSKILQ